MKSLMNATSVALAILLGHAGTASAQHFEFESGDVVTAGNPLDISLVGLPPDTEVEVRAERALKTYYRPGAPTLQYRSAARFRADEDGSVSLPTASAIEGSYTGTDPSGLFWSMQPISDEAVEADERVHLEAWVDGQVVASAVFELQMQPSLYEVEEVDSLPGSYFARHPGPGERPVIILVDGVDSLRYNREILMPQLVAQGYSVLHFATYSLVFGGAEPAEPRLPTRYVDIPLDRLQDAYDWLNHQSGVDVGRIGLYGFSRNGAYVLLAATRFEWVQAVAGIAPSDVVWEGFGDRVQLGTSSSYSWEGMALDYVPYSENYFRETARLARGQSARLRTPMDEGRWANPERVAAARIPIEAYHGALFLAGGEQDNVWSAGHMVQNIAERRAEHNLETTFLVFPDAGHNLVGNGWNPILLFEEGEARAAQARAQYQTWRATLNFFEQALRPEEPE